MTFDDQDDDAPDVQPMTLPEKHAALTKAEEFLREASRVFNLSPETVVTIRRNGEYQGHTTIRKAVEIAKRGRD